VADQLVQALIIAFRRAGIVGIPGGLVGMVVDFANDLTVARDAVESGVAVPFVPLARGVECTWPSSPT
jgi:hypothetical protein